MGQPDREPSLIMQRMALDREAMRGRYTLAVGAVLAVIGALQMSTPDRVVGGVVAALGALCLLAYGLWQVRMSRRQRREFEREHGVDAGKQ